MAESVWPTQQKARLLCIVNGAAMTAARHERKNLKSEAAFSSAQGEGAPDSPGGAMRRSRGMWRLLRAQARGVKAAGRVPTYHHSSWRRLGQPQLITTFPNALAHSFPAYQL